MTPFAIAERDYHVAHDSDVRAKPGRARLSLSYVGNFEIDRSKPPAEALKVIQPAFERAGVRLKKKVKKA